MFVFVCVIHVKTNLSHMYSFTLRIYECLSRHLSVHACITSDEMLNPGELAGCFGTGLKKEREGSDREAPGTLTAASQISEPNSVAFYAIICPSISSSPHSGL